jgi:hypothetical protein
MLFAIEKQKTALERFFVYRALCGIIQALIHKYVSYMNPHTPEQSDVSDSVPLEQSATGQKQKVPQKKREMVGILLSIVFLLAGGVVAFAMYGALDKGSVLDRVSGAMEEVDTFRYEVDMSMKGVSKTTETYGFGGGEETEEYETGMEMAIAGDFYVDTTEKDTVRSKGSMEIEFDIDDEYMGITDEIGFEYVLDGDRVYAMVTRMPTLMAMFGGSAFEDVWIALDFEEIEKLTGEDVSDITASFEMIEKTEQLNEKIEQYVVENPIGAIEKVGTERVKDVETTKYAIEVNAENVVSVTSYLYELLNDIETVNVEGYTFAEIGEMTSCALEYVSFEDVAFWVDEDDLLRKVSMNMHIQDQDDGLAKCDPQYEEYDWESEAEIETYLDVTIKMDVFFSEFNEPVTITAPADAWTLEEVLGGVFGGMGGGTFGVSLNFDTSHSM